MSYPTRTGTSLRNDLETIKQPRFAQAAEFAFLCFYRVKLPTWLQSTKKNQKCQSASVTTYHHTQVAQTFFPLSLSPLHGHCCSAQTKSRQWSEPHRPRHLCQRRRDPFGREAFGAVAADGVVVAVAWTRLRVALRLEAPPVVYFLILWPGY